MTTFVDLVTSSLMSLSRLPNSAPSASEFLVQALYYPSHDPAEIIINESENLVRPLLHIHVSRLLITWLSENFILFATGLKQELDDLMKTFTELTQNINQLVLFKSAATVAHIACNIVTGADLQIEFRNFAAAVQKVDDQELQAALAVEAAGGLEALLKVMLSGYLVPSKPRHTHSLRNRTRTLLLYLQKHSGSKSLPVSGKLLQKI